MGAVLGPSVLSCAFAAWSLRFPLAFLGGLLAAAAAVFFGLGPAEAGRASERARSSGKGEADENAAAALWLTAALLFLYVGAETGMSGWLPLLAERVHGAGAGEAGALASVFWAALLGCRAVTPLALRRWAAARCIAAGVVVFLAGCCCVIVAADRAALLAGAGLAGCGLAPVFPLSVALFHGRGGVAAERRMGVAFACAALGGACLPPLVGVAASLTGNLSRGFGVSLAAGIGMLLLRWKLAALEGAKSVAAHADEAAAR